MQHLGHPIANDPIYNASAAGPADSTNSHHVPQVGALGICDADAAQAVTMQWDWEREAVKELMTRVASTGDAAAISLLARLIRVDMCLSLGPRAAFCERQLRCAGIWLHAYKYSADGKTFEAALPPWAMPKCPSWADEQAAPSGSCPA